VVLVLLLSAVGAYWIAALRGTAKHERAVLKEHARATRAHYAAVGAAEDEPNFSPEVIEKSVTEILAMARGHWRLDHIEALDERLDGGLIRAWAQSWRSQLGSDLEFLGEPAVDIVNVMNRGAETEDRVVLRVRVRIRCRHPAVGTRGAHRIHVDERWTLGRREGLWVLLSVSGDPLADSLLAAPLITDPSSDTERLREESLAESAQEQKLGDEVVLSDLIGADEPARLALLDLSVIDSRFTPALIGADLQHLLETWEAAVTGSEAPFENLASAQARSALLRPAPGARLLMRDAILKSWEPTRVDVSQQPIVLEVNLDVEGVRYVVNDDGRRVAGNTKDPRRMNLAWTLELTDSAQTPWRLLTSNAPAEEIPGWP
jgi:hypothetical protein